MTPYGVDTYPNFVTFNDTTGYIDFTIPSTGYDPKYSFAIYTYIASESNTLYNIVYLNVGASIPWGVANWDVCVDGDSSHWSTWSSGYSLNEHDNR